MRNVVSRGREYDLWSKAISHNNIGQVVYTMRFCSEVNSTGVKREGNDKL